MPNESPNDASELPPPLPGQVPPPLPNASIPPPLPGAPVDGPPPLPGVASTPEQTVPVVKPVAKPVARAVPIQAEPKAVSQNVPEPRQIPTVVSSPAPRVNDAEHHRAQPQVKIAMFVIAGIVLFGCCGFSVLGFAFYKLTESIAPNEPSWNDILENEPPKKVPPEFKELPNPKDVPIVKPPIKPPVSQPTPPFKQQPAPTNPDPTPQLKVPSPQGMKGLQAYVSFDNATLREDVSRNKLAVRQTALLFNGARDKACRFLVSPSVADETPMFVVDMMDYVDLFRFKDDSPFTISLWVRQLSGEGIAFALTQNSIELGPKLLIKSMNRQIDVELYCDKDDSEKKFVRTKSNLPIRSLSNLHHVALTRDKDGTLAVYIDAERINDAPANSLPAKQPVDLAFKRAGFALRTSKLTSIELDEFSLFDRSLGEDEVKALAGRGK